ncbi:MAG: hypothetical protein WCG47_26915 [Dermatophilaceae bacterium]
MTRTDVAKRRPAAGKRAANAARADRPADSPGVTADHSARAERIARIAADLEELANDGLIGDDEAIDLPAVWGRAPSRTTRELAESANLKKAFLTRQSVLQASVSRGQAAALLGLSEQAVTKHLDQGRIVGIKDKGRWAIPAWQLDADTRDGYLDGIDRLARVFPGGPVALTRWVTRPAADFDGRTPRDLLARNRVDEVVRAAQALTAKGW